MMSEFDKVLVFWSPFVAASLVGAILKLAGVIDCPWWMVVLPVTAPIAVLLALLLIFLVIVGTLPRRQR